MPDTITLSLPADTPLPVPANTDGRIRWRRIPDGRIVATYTIEELAWALCCTDLWRVGLERLEKTDYEEEL